MLHPCDQNSHIEGSFRNVMVPLVILWLAKQFQHQYNEENQKKNIRDTYKEGSSINGKIEKRRKETGDVWKRKNEYKKMRNK